jgi:hypothetical protein
MAATLSRKLGVKAGHTLILLGAPDRVSSRLEAKLGAELEGELRVARQLRPAPVECVIVFAERLVDLEDRIGPVTERLHPDGQVWVAWRARRAADITEDVVRRIGLTAGMVDTRVCALDRVWSGMRLVLRRNNREALAYRLDPRRTRRPSSGAGSSGAGSGLANARARRRS